MSEIKHNSIETYLDQLASKQATPGGGSAAALMGAQAAALVSMVCHLTIGKPKYAEVDVEMRELLAEADALRSLLLGMIQADVEVFSRLMASYALPKTTEQEKSYRSEQIQEVLKQATQVPLDCAKACARIIKLSRLAAEKGSLGVISDAGVAVMSGYAGLKSAALNVDINLSSLKDRLFAESKLRELDVVMQGADKDAEAIYQLVKNRL